MAIGKCRLCGSAPVAFGAKTCPHCGGRNPNPGVTDRIAGPAAFAGLFLGAAVGAGFGYTSDRSGMVFVGGMLGALPGLMGGLVVGLIGAGFARLAGVR